MNNAKLIIKSTDADEVSEITYFGRAWKEGAIQFFEYSEMEQSQNTELKVKLILDDKSLIVQRCGEIQMKMVYDESKLSKFSIKVDFAEMDVILHTHHLKIDSFENGFEVEIDYELSFSDGEKFRHKINMFSTYLI